MKRMLWLGLVAVGACSGDDKDGANDDTKVVTDASGVDIGSDTGTDSGTGTGTGTDAVSDSDSGTGTGTGTGSDADGGDEISTVCVNRECGPDPVTHADCGICSAAGKLACNDGKCEAACDATKCGAMSFTSNTCVSSGECDGSPEGSISATTYACNGDKTVCEMSATASDCGLAITDCQPCDLDSTDDGRCKNDVCKSVGEAACKPAACGQRECGPAPGTHEDCGACGEGKPACNDGTCETLCNTPRCEAMSYTENTCVSTGECDGSPSGSISAVTFACEGNVCGMSATASDCGLAITDCMTCDLDGTDDGRCKNEVCVTPQAAACE